MSAGLVFLLIVVLSTLVFLGSREVRRSWHSIHQGGAQASVWVQKANEKHSLSSESREQYQKFAQGHWNAAQSEAIGLVGLLLFVAGIFFLDAYLIYNFIFNTNWGD